MNKSNNWKSLDGLRGLSIIFVVLVHFWAHANREGTGLPVLFEVGSKRIDITWLFATGHNAVILFFCLSGFLLYRRWLEASATAQIGFKQKLNTFLEHRVRRIFPAFLFFLLLYALLIQFVGKHHFSVKLSPVNLSLNLLFLSPIVHLIPIASPDETSLDVIPGTWSLNPEIWFYVAMPLLAKILADKKHAYIPITILSFGSFIFRQHLGDAPPFSARQALPGVADAFLLGMTAAVISRHFKWRHGHLLFPLGAALYIGASKGWPPVIGDSAYQLAAAGALMILGLVGEGTNVWNRLLESPWLTHIGHISYSIFLCNILIAWYFILPLSEIFNCSTEERFLMNIIVGGPATYVLGAHTHRLIEKPFLKQNSSSGPRFRLKKAAALLTFASAVPILLATFSLAMHDGIGTEFNRAKPLMALSKLVPTSMVGMGLRDVPTIPPHHVDSAIGPLFGLLKPLDGDRVIVTISDRRPTWVAINVPADTKLLRQGKRIVAEATLSVSADTDDRVCLGLYDGASDICSQFVEAGRQVHVLVQGTVVEPARLQVKINVVPDALGNPSKITIHRIRVRQET